MSNQIQKLKHIVVRDETYKLIQNEGRFGESADSVVSRVFLAHERHKKGELVIS